MRLLAVLAAADLALGSVREATPVEEALAEELVAAKTGLRDAKVNLSKALDALAIIAAPAFDMKGIRRPFSSYV